MQGSKRQFWSGWQSSLQLSHLATLVALVLSLLSFYRSYIYVSQKLDVTVTEVSYGSNQGELYMTIAFSNAGNRDAAILRVEPAVWTRRNGAKPQWVALTERVHPDIALVTPKPPAIVKSGGVEVLSLSTKLNSKDAERVRSAVEEGAYIGVRVATMNSDGNLYLLEHPVARLLLDSSGRIRSAEPTIHRSLSGFADLQGTPPGDQLRSNKQTPFVWADQQY